MTDAIARLIEKLRLLRPSQLRRVEAIVDSLAEGATFVANPDSNIATDAFCQEVCDALRAHHSASAEPFTKDKFEYAMVRALNDTGHTARKSDMGNPGNDLTVDGVPWSLKTQADSHIKADSLHISKYMELGKGSWRDEADLAVLRQRMFDHMKAYELILSLRCLSRARSPNGGTLYVYELVEIPKALLLEAANFPCKMKHDSRQNPKPGSCYVYDGRGRVKFELYFDGGTERKLQIRSLDKRYCFVHATWTFTTDA